MLDTLLPKMQKLHSRTRVVVKIENWTRQTNIHSLTLNELWQGTGKTTFWGNSKRHIKPMKNQHMRQYEHPCVQVNFKFQISNIHKCSKNINNVKSNDANSKWEPLFRKLEIRNNRPTTNENGTLPFVHFAKTTKLSRSRWVALYNSKCKKHMFTYATVNDEIWRAKTCHRNLW